MYRQGQIKVDNYYEFENLRGHENFDPVLVPRTKYSKMDENILVVEAKLGQSRIRYLNAYGVQENGSISDKMEFFSLLDQEIENAFSNNCFVCLQMDANGKLGNEIITGDPNVISPNGRLLLELISRKSLVIVNATDKCFGTITRMRVKGQITEQSVLDYFVVCHELYNLVVSMLVDEERKYILTRFYKRNGIIKVIESDHNILILNISWDVKVKKERTEIFNLRNKKCQEEFFNSTNNTDVLSKCLNNRNVVTGGKLWLKSVKTLILKSFRKIRLTNQEKKSKVQNLLTKRKEMPKGSVDKEIKKEICRRNKKNNYKTNWWYVRHIWKHEQS